VVRAFICRPNVPEAQVHFQVSPRHVCGGKIGKAADFTPSTAIWSCSFYSTNALYFIYMLLLPEEKMGEVYEHLKNIIIEYIHLIPSNTIL
jgi:hypothetical protein